MKRQNGAALLIALIVVVLAITAGLLSAYNGRNSQSGRDKITETALAQAKAALIAWSASNANFPGQLPCPEDLTLVGTQNEGLAQISCTSIDPMIGRLPWRTLGLGDLRDGNGERLWYVLSPGFRTAPINSDTSASLTIDGVSNAAVALVISPGTPLEGQNRSNNVPLPADYLDSTNATGPNFVSVRSALVNDYVIPVTIDQWSRPVEKRVTGEVIQALKTYFSANHYYPYPANFGDSSCLCVPTSGSNFTCKSNSSTCNNTSLACSGSVCRGRIPANLSPNDWDALSVLRGTTGSSPDWFQKNGWRELIYYGVAPTCAEGTINCNGSGGYLQATNPTSTQLQVVVLATGRLIASQGQTRIGDPAKLSEINYLEDQNINLASNLFSRSLETPAMNDQMATIP